MNDTDQIEKQQRRAYRDVYEFIGRELLDPMNISGNRRGVDPDFWEAAPIPENERGRHGWNRLCSYAHAAHVSSEDDNAAVPGALQASVDFVRLFIGPPKPAAAPWETFYESSKERHVGYGRATVEMKKLLAQEGFALAGSNRQYEDHIGIELLYLSVLCAESNDDGDGKAYRFIMEHPLRWIESLRSAVDAVGSSSYYSALLEYAQGVLEDHALAYSRD